MVKIWSSAIGLESLALLLLARGEATAATVVAYLLPHAAASGLAALAAWRLLPRPFRAPRRYALLSLFGVNFFVPVLGLAATLTGIVAGHLFPQLLRPRLFVEVARPRFTADTPTERERLRGAAARAHLLNRDAAAGSRVAALLAVGTAAHAGNLLRELLSDPEEELRLLAYGLLDRQEKQITAALARERRLLAEAEALGDRDIVREICGRIGALYWELVYADLAQGETERFALAQALSFTERALRGDAADGARWLLIARIRLRRGELAQADEALQEALAWGCPRARVLPYLAELRFLQRRYEAVRRAMLDLGGRPGSDVLAAMQGYWVA
ncbi:MAG: hypothetical protein NZL99_08260 [Burkholderiaceae bacterium]|nr:hypothetical protein [Burkholderiaceae bacterium]